MDPTTEPQARSILGLDSEPGLVWCRVWERTSMLATRLRPGLIPLVWRSGAMGGDVTRYLNQTHPLRAPLARGKRPGAGGLSTTASRLCYSTTISSCSG